MPTHTHPARRTRGLLPLLLLLVITAISGATVSQPDVPSGVDADDGRAPRPKWEHSPSVEATFLRDSYRPGSVATLVLWRNERSLRVRIYRAGPEKKRTIGNITMNGVPVSAPLRLTAQRAHTPVRLQVGDWPSGLYFARLQARDGRVGFAPFVVAPRRLGEHRVLVVLPTYTWQAYNFRDDDQDGRGDTWYAAWKQDWAKLARPYLGRGVPPHFWLYDLPFLRWLARTDKRVDVFSDRDLGAVRTARDLAAAYDAIIFPGHHEYVTTSEYDLVEGYRDLGGNLMFLSANDFFWKITLKGNTMTRVAQWRDLGRPESALIGVQFIGTDEGVHRGGWTVRDFSGCEWLFEGVEAKDGSRFGDAGIEIDHTTADSPKGIHVVADIPQLFGPRFTAQMTYYETTAGAKVFAAGAFTVAGSAENPVVARILENLWQRMTQS
jgi:hypothetical protein